MWPALHRVQRCHAAASPNYTLAGNPTPFGCSVRVPTLVEIVSVADSVRNMVGVNVKFSVNVCPPAEPLVVTPGNRGGSWRVDGIGRARTPDVP